MSKFHTRPEYLMFGAKNPNELDEFFQRSAFLEAQTQGSIWVQSAPNPRYDRTGVDALVDRFRLNQEA